MDSTCGSVSADPVPDMVFHLVKEKNQIWNMKDMVFHLMKEMNQIWNMIDMVKIWLHL